MFYDKIILCVPKLHNFYIASSRDQVRFFLRLYVHLYIFDSLDIKTLFNVFIILREPEYYVVVFFFILVHNNILSITNYNVLVGDVIDCLSEIISIIWFLCNRYLTFKFVYFVISHRTEIFFFSS